MNQNNDSRMVDQMNQNNDSKMVDLLFEGNISIFGKMIAKHLHHEVKIQKLHKMLSIFTHGGSSIQCVQHEGWNRGAKHNEQTLPKC